MKLNLIEEIIKRWDRSHSKKDCQTRLPSGKYICLMEDFNCVYLTDEDIWDDDYIDTGVNLLRCSLYDKRNGGTR